MVLYRTADLMFGSKIQATCVAHGVRAHPCRTTSKWEAFLKEGMEPRVLLIEVGQGQEGSLELIRIARRQRPGVRIIAFGPHIDTEGLRAAHEAGAGETLTRGAMAAQLEEMVRQWGADSGKE